MTVHWFLAHGKDEDKEVDVPETWEEIVILQAREDFMGRVEITFAHADPEFGPDDIEVAAMSLYYKKMEDIGRKNPIWSQAPTSVRHYYLSLAGGVLGDLTEHRKEKRATREKA